MYGLLKGLRVVEGAAFVAGPTCALHLAQMGAEVIRFDSIGGGPDFRRWPLTPAGDSLYWESLNKSKKSVALNLGSPEGRELAVAIATAPARTPGCSSPTIRSTASCPTRSSRRGATTSSACA